MLIQPVGLTEPELRHTPSCSSWPLACFVVRPGGLMSDLNTQPYWDDASSMTRRPALDRDLTVDVVVVGTGITGLTTAYLLKRAGLTVAAIDRGRCGGVDSGMTTAHVTCVTDVDLTELAKTFGRDHAQATWDAGMAAVEKIGTIVEDENIDCEWVPIPGYKHAPRNHVDDRPVQQLRDEAALATELGFDATFLDAVPFMATPGVRIGEQAKFHPRKYLSA